MKLLTGGQFCSSLSYDRTHQLVVQPDSQETRDYLHRIRKNGCSLQCQCGLVFHTVQKSQIFLRRNPGQSIECPHACTLGEDHDLGVVPPIRVHVTPSEKIGLVLNDQRDQKSNPDQLLRHHHHASGHTVRYSSMFSILWKTLDEIGFTGWDPENEPSLNSGWRPFWSKFHQALGKIELGPDLTGSDISFSPFSCRGGLSGFNSRVPDKWSLERVRPEGWIFGIFNQLPFPDQNTVIFKLYSTSYSQREAWINEGKKIFDPTLLFCKDQSISRIGRSGPYILFAAVSFRRRSATDSSSKPLFPTVHRVAIQSIVSEEWPLPVESQYEREVALWLAEHHIRFEKPCFDHDGLRPDFILPDHRLLIEVQGMQSEEYRTHKEEIHRRLLNSDRFRDHRLITYAANDGQTLKEFIHYFSTFLMRAARI